VGRGDAKSKRPGSGKQPGKSKKQGGSAPGEPAPSGYSPAPSFEGLPLGLAGIEANEPPAYLVPIYKQAGRRYEVPWRVLAAINEIETDYGQNLSVSSAGAEGWMQFMPATWAQWGVDADHDGYANPYSPQDAIFAAARYLQASGAKHDLARAIFAYNHADWYVAEVLLRARMLSDKATFARVEQGYALPLQAGYMQQLGRTDDGVDIETPPDGALVYSITPGIVSAVASDPAGFGPNYPVVEATSGSLAGQNIYYGHVAQALVQPGQHVAAGQPIAIVGHTGDAASLGHGHIEIGFSDAGGAPLNQHGAEAWTPAGSVMRAFLVELSASFGVHSS
jgi:murein DD-endopeptidase MepM/ murein hydrolase activator NlpD